MQNLDHMAEIVYQCLIAVELLSREGKGLSMSNLKYGIASLATDLEGYTVTTDVLERACETIGSVMRATGLVIQHDDMFYWKSATVLDDAALN